MIRHQVESSDCQEHLQKGKIPAWCTNMVHRIKTQTSHPLAHKHLQCKNNNRSTDIHYICIDKAKIYVDAPTWSKEAPYDHSFVSYDKKQKINTWDSNVVPHRSTNQARQCLTSLSRREAVLSLFYGRSWSPDKIKVYIPFVNLTTARSNLTF